MEGSKTGYSGLVWLQVSENGLIDFHNIGGNWKDYKYTWNKVNNFHNNCGNWKDYKYIWNKVNNYLVVLC